MGRIVENTAGYTGVRCHCSPCGRVAPCELFFLVFWDDLEEPVMSLYHLCSRIYHFKEASCPTHML